MTKSVEFNGDEEKIPVRAYLHRHSSTCVTTDPAAYENPRELVAWEDVVDHVDWLEKGIAEWRAVAKEPRGASLSKTDLLALRKAIIDLRFLQAAAIVAIGESKQATAYMANLSRLDKLLAEEILK